MCLNCQGVGQREIVIVVVVVAGYMFIMLYLDNCGVTVMAIVVWMYVS